MIGHSTTGMLKKLKYLDISHAFTYSYKHSFS